jgi:TonB family protein
MNYTQRVFVTLALAVVASACFADERIASVSATTLGSAAGAALEMYRPMPAYPMAAFKDGIHQGRVVVGYNVGPDGTVGDVRVLSAYPVQVFTRSAVKAVEKWRYLPGASGRHMVEFTFQSE